MVGQWFPLSTRVSSTNKTDRHYIPEIFLKVALSTKTITKSWILGETSSEHFKPILMQWSLKLGDTNYLIPPLLKGLFISMLQSYHAALNIAHYYLSYELHVYM